jgi:hypothetical protein
MFVPIEPGPALQLSGHGILDTPRGTLHATGLPKTLSTTMSPPGVGSQLLLSVDQDICERAMWHVARKHIVVGGMPGTSK